eukprot:CAMPEP_0116900056 /NCGR_PEP_ID=MMETSP0467-20121206/8474_1 /TAXON_ID=283647 /ORGANISM="Mesodinium pulex, Strain SPMC105" /LENGTH=102 /DNA_ID=CAMNT_0004573193 /DNA_START=1589 /DNA_END=1897 /DNA_ORIENTATION=-
MTNWIENCQSVAHNLNDDKFQKDNTKTVQFEVKGKEDGSEDGSLDYEALLQAHDDHNDKGFDEVINDLDSKYNFVRKKEEISATDAFQNNFMNHKRMSASRF